MGLFRKKIDIYAPFSGTILPLEEVPDEAFAKKMIGDGLAIQPNQYNYVDVYSINEQGNIHLFHTHHVISYKIKKLEILFHIGLNTIKIQEKWIEVIGNTIPLKANINTVLLRVNYNAIVEKGLSPISPIITNTPELLYDINIHKQFGTPVSQGDLIMTFHML